MIKLENIVLNTTAKLKNIIGNTNDQLFHKMVAGIGRRYKIAFICGIITGIAAHGLALFNKYSFHDDVGSLFTVGATLGSGRWFLHILSWRIIGIFGRLHSTPLWDGGVAILLIVFSSMILIWTFDIRSKILCGCLSAFMICFPVVSGMLGFMFVSPYYSFALLISIMGAGLLVRKRHVVVWIISVVSMACSLGIYQAYLPIFISILVISIIMACAWGEDDWKGIFLKGIYYLSAIMSSVMAYIFANNYMLRRYHMEISDYKGMDRMGIISLEELPKQIALCYKTFFDVSSTMLFPKVLTNLYYSILVWGGILSFILIYRISKKNRLCCLFLLIATILFPLAVNFHYVMVSLEVGRSTLQCYGYVMIVVWMVALLDFVERKGIRFQRVYNGIGLVLLFVDILSFIRLDNANYLKAEMLRTRVIGYYTTMVTQIKSVDGYKDELPITYIKYGDIKDQSLYEMEIWDEFYIHPYCSTDYAVTYAWEGYIRYWLGFNPERRDSNEFVNLEEVREMPVYPDDGSIKIINDTIVVKLTEV